jgi:hypothetical protein
MPSLFEGFWAKALLNSSAQQAYDLPDPTGPINPLTNELSLRNFQTIGEDLKSSFNGVIGSQYFFFKLFGVFNNLF